MLCRVISLAPVAQSEHSFRAAANRRHCRKPASVTGEDDDSGRHDHFWPAAEARRGLPGGRARAGTEIAMNEIHQPCWSSGRVLRGEASQLDPRADTQLCVDMSQVGVDGVPREEQLGGGLAICEALGNKLRDASLSLRQALPAKRRGSSVR